MKVLDLPTSKAAEALVSDDREQQHYLASLIRPDFEKCHPGETFDDLKRRAPLTRDGRGLLRDWMALWTRRATERGHGNERPWC